MPEIQPTSKKIGRLLWSLPASVRGNLSVLIDDAMTIAETHQTHCITADESSVYTGDYHQLKAILKELKHYAR